eukprot:9472353-Pyramimonas_sp.AAC.1
MVILASASSGSNSRRLTGTIILIACHLVWSCCLVRMSACCHVVRCGREKNILYSYLFYLSHTSGVGGIRTFHSSARRMRDCECMPTPH